MGGLSRILGNGLDFLWNEDEPPTPLMTDELRKQFEFDKIQHDAEIDRLQREKEARDNADTFMNRVRSVVDPSQIPVPIRAGYHMVTDFLGQPKKAVDTLAGLLTDQLPGLVDARKGNEAGQLAFNTAEKIFNPIEAIRDPTKPSLLQESTNPIARFVQQSGENIGALATDPNTYALPGSKALSALFVPGMIEQGIEGIKQGGPEGYANALTGFGGLGLLGAHHLSELAPKTEGVKIPSKPERLSEFGTTFDSPEGRALFEKQSRDWLDQVSSPTREDLGQGFQFDFNPEQGKVVLYKDGQRQVGAQIDPLGKLGTVIKEPGVEGDRSNPEHPVNVVYNKIGELAQKGIVDLSTPILSKGSKAARERFIPEDSTVINANKAIKANPNELADLAEFQPGTEKAGKSLTPEEAQKGVQYLNEDKGQEFFPEAQAVKRSIEWLERNDPRYFKKSFGEDLSRGESLEDFRLGERGLEKLDKRSYFQRLLNLNPETSEVGALGDFGQNLESLKRIRENAPNLVRDKEGKAQEYFHGTPKAGFEEFGETRPTSLYGPGSYFTDNPEIASTYSKGKEPLPKNLQDQVNKASNEIYDILVSNKKTGSKLPAEAQLPEQAKARIAELRNQIAQVTGEHKIASEPSPGVYKTNLTSKKAFDIDKKYSEKEVKEMFPEVWDKQKEAEKQYGGSILSNTGKMSGQDIYTNLENMFEKEGGKTGLSLEDKNVGERRAKIQDYLKSKGYDSITHTGGVVSGGKKHKVRIVFDPKEQIYPPYMDKLIQDVQVPEGYRIEKYSDISQVPEPGRSIVQRKGGESKEGKGYKSNATQVEQELIDSGLMSPEELRTELPQQEQLPNLEDITSRIEPQADKATIELAQKRVKEVIEPEIVGLDFDKAVKDYENFQNKMTQKYGRPDWRMVPPEDSSLKTDWIKDRDTFGVIKETLDDTRKSTKFAPSEKSFEQRAQDMYESNIEDVIDITPENKPIKVDELFDPETGELLSEPNQKLPEFEKTPAELVQESLGKIRAEKVRLAESKPIRTDAQKLERIKELRQQNPGMSLKDARDRVDLEESGKLVDIESKPIPAQPLKASQVLDTDLTTEQGSGRGPGRPPANKPFSKKPPSTPPGKPPEIPPKKPTGNGEENQPPGGSDNPANPQGPKSERSTLDLITDIPKELKSSMDISFPFRQGLFLLNRPTALKGMMRGIKNFFSESGHNETKDYLANKWVNKDLAKESGLAQIEYDPTVKTATSEEFGWQGLGKLPGFKHSERSFIDSGNLVRANMFDEFVRRNPGKEPEFYKGVADYLNALTGRTPLPKSMARVSNVANKLLWSPRFIASRVQLLNPVFYARLPKEIKVAALRDVAGTLAAVSLVTGGIKAAGDAKGEETDIGVNPLKGNFGYVRVGQTSYNLFAGLTPLVKLYSRLITGRTEEKGGTRRLAGWSPGTALGFNEDLKPASFGHSTIGELGRFARGKESPAVGALHNLGEGKDYLGQKFTSSDLPEYLASPLAIQDFVQAYKQGGLEEAVKTLPGLAGVGVQVQKPLASKKSKTKKKKTSSHAYPSLF